MNDTKYMKLIAWREKHIKEKHFILILSFLVGIFTSVAALILKWLIHFIQSFLMTDIQIGSYNYMYLVYPIIGILLSGVFVKYILKEDISHGVTKILYAISQRKSRIKAHNTWSSVVASSATIGFGGSVGAEAPIVLTGAAIGSNLGRFFKMDQRTLMLLVGCGAAGAIAGIFKAPIAGLIFTIEVLMLDLTMASVLPLLIASVTAATMSYIFTDPYALFDFTQKEEFTVNRIPYVLMLGIACGLSSLYFTRSMRFAERIFRKIKNYWGKFLLGGVSLSLLIFLLPPLYGEGYDTIETLLSGHYGQWAEGSLFQGMNDRYWALILFLGLILLLKVFATAATNAGGGCGGIFAPSLFLGCIVGFGFSYTLNHFGIGSHLPQDNFALMGMAGMMAGVMHAPLTGVFLIAELTGGYDLFLPLMIVSISSYLTIIAFEPHSIYAMRLAQKGELLTHHKDKAVLTLLDVSTVIETNFQEVHPEMTLGDMVKTITQSARNLFPVTDHNGVLKGVVLLDDIRNIMFRPELYDRFVVRKFMVSPPAKININMPMEKIMRLFDETEAWNLPVVDDHGKYCGFVSKSKIFNSYREVLLDNFSEE